MTMLVNILTVLSVVYHGQVADASLHKWFESLSSPSGGYCCAETDGIKVDDPSWGHDEQGYWVFLDGARVRVPLDTVVNKHNPSVNYAVVWAQRQDGRPWIRCFLPGTES